MSTTPLTPDQFSELGLPAQHTQALRDAMEAAKSEYEMVPAAAPQATFDAPAQVPVETADDAAPETSATAEDPFAAPGEGEQKPEPQTAHAPSADERLAKLEQAQRSLQGKYNAEVPRLNAELRQHKAVLEQKNELIQILQQQLAARTAAPAAPPPDTPSHLSVEDQLRQLGYGDFADKYDEGAQEMFLASIKASEQRASKAAQDAVKPYVEGMEQNRQNDFASRFWSDPDVNRLNNDPEFLAWVDEEDGLRRERFNRSLQSMNIEASLKPYKQFAALKAQGAPNEQKPTAPVKPKPNISAQVMPTTRPGVSAPPAKPRIYTGKEIEDLSAQATHAMACGRDYEGKHYALLQELNAAAAQGRIKYDAP